MYLDDRENPDQSVNQSINQWHSAMFNPQMAIADSAYRKEEGGVVSCDVDQCRLTCISEANRHGAEPSLIGLGARYLWDLTSNARIVVSNAARLHWAALGCLSYSKFTPEIRQLPCPSR